jgi:hypothetical protein
MFRYASDEELDCRWQACIQTSILFHSNEAVRRHADHVKYTAASVESQRMHLKLFGEIN